VELQECYNLRQYASFYKDTESSVEGTNALKSGSNLRSFFIMMPYPTYLRLQLQKFDFVKKAYFYPSVIDIEKDIKTIHDIHLRLGGLLTAAILDTDDKSCCDYLEASYLLEAQLP
jgi:hypothetical protein